MMRTAVLPFLLPSLLSAFPGAEGPPAPASTPAPADFSPAAAEQFCRRMGFSPPADENAPDHSLAQAREAFQQLGARPALIDELNLLNQVEDWRVPEAETAGFEALLKQIRTRLKGRVTGKLDELFSQIPLQPDLEAADPLFGEARPLLFFGIRLVTKDEPDGPAVLEKTQQRFGDLFQQMRRREEARHNQWALGLIEEGFAELARSGADDTLPARLAGKIVLIDPDSLQPAVRALYDQLLGEANGRLTVAGRIQLARRLLDPTVKRPGAGGHGGGVPYEIYD